MNFSLFGESPPEASAIWAPSAVRAAMEQSATLAISISGGKDSQALLSEVVKWHRQNHFEGALYAIHADLGRSEWPQTAAFVESLCERANIELRVVRRAKGDLIARFEERIEATRASGAPFWPDSQNRYCTSHLKSDPIDIELRKPAPFWPSAQNRYCTSDLKRGPIDGELRGGQIVISAEGVRAVESFARAKKSVVEIRKGITAASKNAACDLRSMEPEAALAARAEGQRVALNWRPLLHWSEEDVWRACGTSGADLKRRRMLCAAGNDEAALDGWPAHPAYIWGNSRLSCGLCILAGENDLTNGANRNPQLYREYLELERRGGATFKHNWSLSELRVSGEAARLRDEFLSEVNI